MCACARPTILSLLPPSLMTMYASEMLEAYLGDHWACHGKCWPIVCSKAASDVAINKSVSNSFLSGVAMSFMH